MLSILGFLMICTFLYLIMTKRVTPFIGLIVIPVLFGLLGGFGPRIGEMMLEGMKNTAPTAFLILFAILYFAVMIDAGLFDPLTHTIIKYAKGDPLKIVVGSAIVAGVVGFDGDGSSTIMIVMSAFLPIYLKLGIRPIILATITATQIGITSLVPWGGPLGRVASVLNLDPTSLFINIFPGMIAGVIYVVIVAYFLGKKERVRLGIQTQNMYHVNAYEEHASTVEFSVERRPKLIWINAALTIVIMIALILEWFPSAALFIFGTALALLINYPSINDMKNCISKHSYNALNITSIILAAGVFSGILKGTGMSEAMAQSLISIIPTELVSYISLIIAIIGPIVLFLIGPDAYFFGIIPVLAETASSYGISATEIATASLYGAPIGFIGPLVGAMYLLTEMAQVNLVDVQKNALKLLVGVVIIFLLTGLALGQISL